MGNIWIDDILTNLIYRNIIKSVYYEKYLYLSYYSKKGKEDYIQYSHVDSTRNSHQSLLDTPECRIKS